MQTAQDLEILGKYGKNDLAILYIAKFQGKIVEFVESVQPPVPREEKWVIILSTLYGCPIQCKMCDAGQYFHGKVPKEGMFAQIDHILSHQFPDRNIPISKLKIQFARMGEPTLNPDVLSLLEELPSIYNAPGLLPCVSTVAPLKGAPFLSDLLVIKDNYYNNGRFQLQFSIHSTDEIKRKELMNSQIWSMKKIAEFGDKWYSTGDRKITLNFAAAKDSIIDPNVILGIFDPQLYLIKITPINPTNQAQANQMTSLITTENYKNHTLGEQFKKLGYDTILSFGEWEENLIGSNCGQYATEWHENQVKIKKNYTCSNYALHF